MVLTIFSDNERGECEKTGSGKQIFLKREYSDNDLNLVVINE